MNPFTCTPRRQKGTAVRSVPPAQGAENAPLMRALRPLAAIPELFLLWLSLRQLFKSLETLFSAWRAGTLPPQPVAPAAPVARISAPRPRRARSKSYARKPRSAIPRRRRPAPKLAPHPVPPRARTPITPSRFSPRPRKRRRC